MFPFVDDLGFVRCNRYMTVTEGTPGPAPVMAPPGPDTGDRHHTHRKVNGGWLRAATFGAMDGLVTNTSLIAGGTTVKQWAMTGSAAERREPCAGMHSDGDVGWG